MQLFVDLGNESAEMQLFGKLAGVEIAHRCSLNFRGIDLRVVDRFFTGLGNQVPDGFAFLLQVALKIGPAAAEDVNFVHSMQNLLNPQRSTTARCDRMWEGPQCRDHLKPSGH